MRPINLLPQKAKEKAGVRRRQALLLFVALLFLAALAAAVVWYEGKVSDAQDEVAAEQAIVSQLEGEISGLRDLEQIKLSFDSRVAVIGDILGADIAWGRLLNDFGRLIPPRVWLTSFTASTLSIEGDPSLGIIQVSGTAFDYTDVGSWLRVLDSSSFPGVGSTWVASATTASVGDAGVVDFSSSTALTEDARSDRFERLIPVVP